MKKKGLKDIKTMRDVSKSRTTTLESPGNPARQKHRQGSPESSNHPMKTWVFTQKPKFERVSKSLLVDRVEEPHVDVFEETESIVIIADLTGVLEESIQTKSLRDVFLIEAAAKTINGVRKYSKEILVPFMIDPYQKEISFKNGILEITLYRSPRDKQTKEQPK